MKLGGAGYIYTRPPGRSGQFRLYIGMPSAGLNDIGNTMYRHPDKKIHQSRQNLWRLPLPNKHVILNKIHG